MHKLIIKEGILCRDKTKTIYSSELEGAKLNV
jgi:hypothetical protein